MELPWTTLYVLAELLSTILPNVTVTDAQVIHDYYLARYNAPSTMIAYGAEVERKPDRDTVKRWRVEPNRYVLYVSRLEPENNAHLVIEAFKRVRTAYKLLVVGDAPYAHDYIQDLETALAVIRELFYRIVWPDYRALQQNSYVMCSYRSRWHASRPTGAMGFGTAY